MWFWLKQPLVGKGARCITSPNDGCDGEYRVADSPRLRHEFCQLQNKCLNTVYFPLQLYSYFASTCFKTPLAYHAALVVYCFEEFSIFKFFF